MNTKRDSAQRQAAALGCLSPGERVAFWRAALALHDRSKCIFMVSPDPDGHRPFTAAELAERQLQCVVCGRSAREDDFAEVIAEPQP